MKLAVVVEALPSPGSVGSEVFAWGILTHLRSVGHDVLCCAIVAPPDEKHRAEFAAKVANIEQLGITLRVFPLPHEKPAATGLIARLTELLRPDLERIFPSLRLSKDLISAIASFRPDSTFVFDTGPVLALASASFPRVAVPGDPAHLVRAYQRQFLPKPPLFSRQRVTHAISAAAFQTRFVSALVAALRRYEKVGYLGQQHAEWIQGRGVACEYVKMCVADRAGADWRAKRAKHRSHEKLKLLFLGHLGGTASRAGLDEFVDVTVPLLEKKLGADKFELHIVGRGLPAALIPRFQRPGVVLRGFVEDAGAEFLSADVFLSPTPYPVGIRTRIVEAFSWGTPVVTHPYSARGLPELKDGENVLLGRNGGEWADAVVRLASEPALRERLSAAGRKTYEDNFIPAVSAGQILRMMTDAAASVR